MILNGIIMVFTIADIARNKNLQVCLVRKKRMKNFAVENDDLVKELRNNSVSIL